MRDILVIGMNTLCRTLAAELERRHARVTVFDKDRLTIERVKHEVSAAVILDATNKDALEDVGVDRFDAIVVSLAGDLEAAERTTLALERLGARRVLAIAGSQQHARILRRLGADHVFTPGVVQARSLAIEVSEDALDGFRFYGEQEGLAEVRLRDRVRVPHDDVESWCGGRVRYVGIRRGQHVDLAPGADLEGGPGDVLLLFGRPDDIVHFVQTKLPASAKEA